MITRPTCECGHFMIIRDTACGLASYFYWTCPKDRWWSFKNHSYQVVIGTTLPEELYIFYGSKKNST